MNKKNTIRLTESELKRIISESVKNVLKEGKWDGDGSEPRTIDINQGNPIGYTDKQGGYGYPNKTKYHPNDIWEMFEEYNEISQKLSHALRGTMGKVGDKVADHMNKSLKMARHISLSSNVMGAVESPVVDYNRHDSLTRGGTRKSLDYYNKLKGERDARIASERERLNAIKKQEELDKEYGYYLADIMKDEL